MRGLRRCLPWALLAAAALAAARAAHAQTQGAPLRIHVRGSAQIEAVAWTEPDGFVVRGSVVDDARSAIAEAPHFTIGPDIPLEEAFRFLEAEDAERVPVVDEHHRLLGVLSRSVLQRRLAEDEGEPLPPAA